MFDILIRVKTFVRRKTKMIIAMKFIIWSDKNIITI